MAKEQVIVIGAGAAARYTAYVLSYSSTLEVIGFTDSQKDKWNTCVLGKPVLGSDGILASLAQKGIMRAAIGIGKPQLRRSLCELLSGLGFELVSAVHPTAILSPAVTLGKGVIIEAGSVLSDNPVVGDNVWIGLAAMVAHDTVIGRDSCIGGGAAVGAGVRLGEQVLVGWGSVIQSGRQVGDGAIVGSGANVVDDVPARAVVVGNPARVIRYTDP